MAGRGNVHIIFHDSTKGDESPWGGVGFRFPKSPPDARLVIQSRTERRVTNWPMSSMSKDIKTSVNWRTSSRRARLRADLSSHHVRSPWLSIGMLIFQHTVLLSQIANPHPCLRFGSPIFLSGLSLDGSVSKLCDPITNKKKRTVE